MMVLCNKNKDDEKHMKKFWTIITSLVLVFCSSYMLVACGNKADEQDSITKAKLNNVKSFYQTTDTVDFDAMTLTITTTKSGEKTLTKAQFDLQAVSEAEADTEFVVFTDGLKDETPGELTKGEYSFSVYVVAYGKKFENLIKVNVTDDLSETYDLVEYKDPAFVSTYKSNVASISETERAFYQASAYEVGADNEFEFKPSMTLVNKETDQLVLPDNYNVVLTVKHDGQTVTDDTYYTFNDFKFQFKANTAIGETFEISMLPKDFTHDENGAAVSASTLTVTVRDGYNVSQSNVKDLGRMSLVTSSFDATDAFNENSNTDGYRYIGSDSENIYYNKTTQQTRQDGNAFDYWAAYYAELAQEDSHYANATAVNGIFIHGDIVVTANDLPSDFFISVEEAKVGTNSQDPAVYGHLVGTPRDFMFAYSHYMESNDFTFNGNMFKIDFSSIPFGLTNKDTGITGTGFYYTADQNSYAAGHSSLFNFIGRGDNSVTKEATFKNVNLVGNFVNIDNISGDDIDMKASGSFIGVKSISANLTASNCLMHGCLVGMYSEFNHGENCMLLDHCKVYDCYNSGLFTWFGENNRLVHSEIKNFGGPAIFVVSGTKSDNVDSMLIGYPEAMASFDIDSESIVESYVVGDEVWFVLNHAQSAAMLFTGDNGVNAALAQYGVTFIKDVDGKEKINMKGLFMDRGAIDPTSAKFCLYGEMSFGDSSIKLLEIEDYNRIMAMLQGDQSKALEISSPIYQLFLQYQAGIIMTNGGTFATVGFNAQGGVDISLIGQINENGEMVAPGETMLGDLMYIFVPTNPTTSESKPLPNAFLCLALELDQIQQQ